MIAWFTRHPVAANLLMLSLLIGGLLSLSNMRKEIIPRLPVSTVVVSSTFAGRTAEQVDAALAQKLQHAVEGINGIAEIKTYAADSYVEISIKKQLDYSIDRLVSDIKVAVDNIYDWPQQASRPQVSRAEATFDALMVQLSGQADSETLDQAATLVRKALLANPAIHQLKTYGVEDKRIYIDLLPEKLREYQIDFGYVHQQINQQSVRSKSGVLKTDNGRLLLFSDSQAEFLADFQNLVIKTTAQGRLIKLADIATVTDKFEEHDSKAAFNGEKTIGFAIKMTASSDVMLISEQAHAVVADLTNQLPQQLSVEIWFDSSLYVGERLNLLQSNAWQGFVLVFLLLTLFLQMKLAFWVAMGLPVAIAGTFIVLGELGFAYTLNEITTFGFILVLGILVDDAVVVGESIYQAKKEQGNSLEATIVGAKKVALPTILGVLTTVVALVPMTQFPSETGRLFASFAWVVIIALLFSLIESKFILPAHLRHIDVTEGAGRLAKWRQYPQLGLDWLRDLVYAPALSVCLRYRYACLVMFSGVAVLILGQLANGKIRTVLFPDVTSDLIIVTLEMEPNAPLALIEQAYQKVEQARVELNQSYRQRYQIDGDIIEKSMTVMIESGQVLAFAEPLNRVKRGGASIRTLANLWRAQLEPLEAVQSVETMVSFGGEASENHLVLQHSDKRVLAQAGQALREQTRLLAGVLAAKDTQAANLPQLAFSLKQHAQLHGLTPRMLSEQIAAAYGGLEVDRFYRQGNEVQVFLRLPKALRDSSGDLQQMYIANNQGQYFPLHEVADIELEQVNNVITRLNGKLSRTLAVELDKSQLSGEALFTIVEQQILPALQQEYPGLQLVGAGAVAQAQKTNKGLITAFCIAFVAIYVLLALALKRYDQPFIIMAAIPFGLVGAVLGHMLLGLPVSLYSWLGMLTLSGVVVNDSLLIVNRFNEAISDGKAKMEAIIEACRSRFRAIMLTTATTYIGLMPLLSETSEQAQYLIPAVVSMAYGLLFATFITLLLIPLILLISAEIKAFLLDETFANEQACRST